MTPQDLHRVRSITRNFTALQGFRLTVPMGTMLIGNGVGSLLANDRFPQEVQLAALAFQLLLLAAAFVLLRWGRSYYTDRFGQVDLHPGSWSILGRRQILVLVLTFLAGAMLVFVTWHPSRAGWARLLYLVLGASAVATWLLRRCDRAAAHYLVLGLILAAMATPRPASGFLFPALAEPGMAFVASGAALVIAGLLDHWVLVRAMRQLAPEPPALAGEAEEPAEARR